MSKSLTSLLEMHKRARLGQAMGWGGLVLEIKLHRDTEDGMTSRLAPQPERRPHSSGAGESERALLPHQLTAPKIKYLLLHLEEPQVLVECLGAKINQRKHSPLGQTESVKTTLGKAKHFGEGS